MKTLLYVLLFFFIGLVAAFFSWQTSNYVWLALVVSAFLFIHSSFTLFWMLYAWENPDNSERHKSPKVFEPPSISFTALIPARHESRVIEDTINAVANINYPEDLKETLILCREDDLSTIQIVRTCIQRIGRANVKLFTFDSPLINKPSALNHGLIGAKKDVVVIFDAEDNPHKDIYNIANTIMLRDKSDVLQSGVQLMNFRSHWFSPMNVLEYFFWFKSGMFFFNRIGKAFSLAGNTVFIKKNLLHVIGGWDENKLTEDADISPKLLSVGAKFSVVYDEAHTTHEETPRDIGSFIKQRTRWNQGFLQVVLCGVWKKAPTLKQRLTFLYIYLSPQVQTLLILYIPFALWVGLTQKLPIIFSIFTFLPFFLLLLQLVTYILGLYIFIKDYRLKGFYITAFFMLLTFIPYQIILTISSVRSLIRSIVGSESWEKTAHFNDHRVEQEPIRLEQFQVHEFN